VEHFLAQGCDKVLQKPLDLRAFKQAMKDFSYTA